MSAPADDRTETLPLVSVVIPTRGRPELLRETLATHRRARTTPGRWRSWSSTTARRPTRAWPSSAATGARVRSDHQRRHRRVWPAPATAGCGTPSGPIVASCDDDDLWHPAKIRRQVERLVADPQPAGRRHRDPAADGRPATSTGPASRRRSPTSDCCTTGSRSCTARRWRCGAPPSPRPGEYDEDLPHGYGEDYDWLLRASPGRARSAWSPRSWPTSARTSRRGSAAGRSTPPTRWSTSSPSTPTSRAPRAATPGCSARSPTPGRTAGERGARPAHRRAGAAAATRRHRTPGSACSAPAPASSPQRVLTVAAPVRTGRVVSQAAQLPLHRARQGRVVVAARDPDPASGRLPDARPRTSTSSTATTTAAPSGTPSSSATPADETGRRRGLPGLPVPPRAPRRGSHETLGPAPVDGVAARPGGARLVVVPLRAQARHRARRLRRPRCAPSRRCSSTGATPAAWTASCEHFPRELRPRGRLRRPGRGPAGVPGRDHGLPGGRPDAAGEEDLEARLPAAAARSVRRGARGPPRRRLGPRARRRPAGGRGQAVPARPAGALPADRQERRPPGRRPRWTYIRASSATRSTGWSATTARPLRSRWGWT